ncbi:hypothetical protein D1BOALGB6SA_10242 [Olavius sp. associated proteobacterium Delta 1]|nr:hypothetical protein D1BOALGB6SA_10242 [Olavius sp. associated proteobacterium Delta 1]
MLKNFIMCLLIVIYTMACAAFGDKKQALLQNMDAESTNQQEHIDIDELPKPDRIPSSDWRPFKGVLLRHIVANCCFSESQNTVILGQDNNRDQKVDKCYQLKGKEGKIYYRTIECPDNLAPVKVPQREKNLECNLH